MFDFRCRVRMVVSCPGGIASLTGIKISRAKLSQWVHGQVCAHPRPDSRMHISLPCLLTGCAAVGLRQESNLVIAPGRKQLATGNSHLFHVTNLAVGVCWPLRCARSALAAIFGLRGLV